MAKVLKWLTGIPLLLLAASALFYTGSCVYANFIQSPVGSGIKTPDVKTAQIQVTIVNTGNVLFTNSHEQRGRVHILHGYWELVGQKYQYRSRDVILDEAIFGPIRVERREQWAK